MNKPQADLGYEMKYEDKPTLCLKVWLCFFLLQLTTIAEQSPPPPSAFAVVGRGETIRAIGGRVISIGERIKDSVGGRVKDGKIERQSA